MVNMKTVRNYAFLFLVCLTTYAMQARIIAAMGDSLKTACNGWKDGDGYDCTHCSRGLGFPPEWEAEGSCDFSGIEDEEERLQTAAAYCMELMFAFDETCESEYGGFLVGYYTNNLSEQDPCYAAATTSSCWFGWATASCDAGEFSTWSGGCQGFNMCEC